MEKGKYDKGRLHAAIAQRRPFIYFMYLMPSAAGMSFSVIRPG